MIEELDVVILGGGVAGLGAALKARETGRQAVIFEARGSAGGLLDNFTIDGFRFDHAVHLSFASEEKVRSIFDRTPYITHPSDSYCFDQDRWLKHPVQNNLAPLDASDKVALIKSFLARPSELAGDDYESWLRHQYGDGISERYPIRYTQKYWATPASALSTTWIGQRMRRAELDEILYGAMTTETPNTYYTKEMRYPQQGGYKAFIAPLIADSEIRLEHRATAIDTQQRTVTFANGATVRYRQLVSTLPPPSTWSRLVSRSRSSRICGSTSTMKISLPAVPIRRR
jgi:protoporphyrinogen oxidase